MWIKKKKHILFTFWLSVMKIHDIRMRSDHQKGMLVQTVDRPELFIDTSNSNFSSFSASHSLQCIYTATVRQGSRFPEFTVVCQLDGEQIVYYDSDTRKMIPKTEWMKRIGAGDPEATLKASVVTLMERFNQTTGDHE